MSHSTKGTLGGSHLGWQNTSCGKDQILFFSLLFEKPVENDSRPLRGPSTRKADMEAQGWVPFGDLGVMTVTPAPVSTHHSSLGNSSGPVQPGEAGWGRPRTDLGLSVRILGRVPLGLAAGSGGGRCWVRAWGP